MRSAVIPLGIKFFGKHHFGLTVRFWRRRSFRQRIGGKIDFQQHQVGLGQHLDHFGITPVIVQVLNFNGGIFLHGVERGDHPGIIFPEKSAANIYFFRAGHFYLHQRARCLVRIQLGMCHGGNKKHNYEYTNPFFHL